MKKILVTVIILLAAPFFAQAGDQAITHISKETTIKIINELVTTHGQNHAVRIKKGVGQSAALWRISDGSEADFAAFCKKHFIADAGLLSDTLKRVETDFEILWGNFHVINRDLYKPFELAGQKKLPIDELFANYSPDAHLKEDLFKTKAAFAVILNFPHYSLQEKKELGKNWTREQWAAAAAGDIFTSRVPPEINQKFHAAIGPVSDYTYKNNIFMGRLLNGQNKTLFPGDLKLLNHWGLRDRLRTGYTAGPGGLEEQEMIYRVMLRSIDQSIPLQVIDNPDYYWNPFKNALYREEKGKFVPVKIKPEGGQRYRHFLSLFHRQRLLDPYFPGEPDLIQRIFDVERKIPEKVVEKLLIQVLESPLAQEVARLIEKRVGRPLRPFDLWYDGLQVKKNLPHRALDKKVAEKYPGLDAFRADIPRILRELGFAPEKAKFIADRIEVDSSKGMGHAAAHHKRGDKAHLRVRLFDGGLNHINYNLLIHELGHNVEQVCSLDMMDHYLLKGTPNYAFTEAFAFMFGSRALELLGVRQSKKNDPARDLEAFWFTYETAGVALIDMKIWRWLYANPEATAAGFQAAVIRIAKEVWNKYFAVVFNQKDVPILVIYSHLIGGELYFPDYPIGKIISAQVEKYLAGKNLGVEMERMCKIGALPPEFWMREAVGGSLSAAPLLEAAQAALKRNFGH